MSLVTDIFSSHYALSEAKKQLESISSTYERLVSSAKELGYNVYEENGELKVEAPKKEEPKTE